MKRGKGSELLQVLGPVINAFQALKTELKDRGISPDDLPGVLALSHLLATGQKAAEARAEVVPSLSLEGVGLKELAPPPRDRVPYTRIAGYWTLDGEDPQEKAAEINRLLKRLIGRWEFVEYFLGGRSKEFPYRVTATPAELEELGGRENRWLKIIYKNNENRFLTLETSLLAEEPLIFSLTSYHPDFIQGVHNLEDDFYDIDRDVLLEILADLQEHLHPGGAKYNVEEVALEELGDRYNVSYFDE